MDRMQTFTRQELDMLHNASMEILDRTGMDFNHEKTARLFKSHGIKTEGTKVFLTEKQVLAALDTVPSKFKIHARNPEKSVDVGEDSFIFMPTGGAPNVAEPDGSQRPATLADFINCCKLVHTSDQLDMGGYIMVQPNDIPAETSHLDMISNYFLFCDKPVFGGSATVTAALDTIEMAGLFFGGKEALKQKPVMNAVANVASPLQFSEEQTEVIVAMAEYNQPTILTNMILAGASGSISLPSLLALQNAEILAGIVLSQLVSPGAPVVFGSTSAPMDMKTMTSAVGASETLKIANATTQLARYYKLPSRCGGGLTDAHLPDGQAFAESALMLSTVVRNGVNVVYHSCGQMGSFISMSFEKWMIDEEICKTVRELICPIDLSPDSFDTDLIHDIGIGGQYLTHPKTFDQFKQLSQPILFNRKDYSKWLSSNGKAVHECASQKVADRLDAYERPYIDSGIEKALLEFVAMRKKELLSN